MFRGMDEHSATHTTADDVIDLGALYGRFGPMLTALAGRALPPALVARLDAADVVQETFAAANARYTRALERLRARLLEISEFRS